MNKNRYKKRTNKPKKRSNKRIVKLIPYLRMSVNIIAGIIVLMFLSFTFIFGHDFLTQTDYFNAKKLETDGNQRLSSKEILEQTEIKKGVNILSVNLSLARKKLLAHPWVHQAEVKRELPDKIIITIVEHRPLAIVDLGKKFLINEHGNIFKVLESSDPSNIPVIYGLEFLDLNVFGEPCSIPFESVMKVLRLGQNPESVIPNQQLKSIQVDKEMGITLHAFDNVKAIRVGYNGYKNKYERLRNILVYIKKTERFKGFNWIDLNNLDRIVVNPMNPESSTGDDKEV